MAVTIYHNPKCGTSRTVLGILRGAGIEPKVVEYLETPLDRAELKALLARIGIGPREILRRRGTPYDELGLDSPDLSDAALLGHIAEHPILMERPVVVTPKGAKVCRPADVVRTLI
jgi:arsenate reductase